MTKKINKGFSLVELSIVIVIIGVLVAAVGQGLDLLADSRLAAARVITQGSRVNSLKNLVLWLETTKEESISSSEAQDGVGVSTWSDINPQATVQNNASQSNVSFQPSYVSSCIGNLPCLRFDGVNDFMDTTSNLNLKKTLISVFIVAGSQDFLTTSYNILTTLDEGGNVSGSIPWEFNSDVIISNRFSVNTAGSGTFASNGGLKNGNLIFSITFNEKSVVTSINSDSAKKDIPNTIFLPSLQLIEIGAFPPFLGSQRTRYLKGNISEIIMFSRGLSVKEADSVRSYLSKKWSINLS